MGMNQHEEVMLGHLCQLSQEELSAVWVITKTEVRTVAKVRIALWENLGTPFRDDPFNTQHCLPPTRRSMDDILKATGCFFLLYCSYSILKGLQASIRTSDVR